jgi:hypothetical protein
MDGVRGAGIAGLAVAGCVVLPWYLIELHQAGIRLGPLGRQVWMPLLGGAAVGLAATDLTRLPTNNLTILLAGGVVALGTIALLIYHRLPDLTMLRSVFANVDAPAVADDGTGQQAGEHVAEEPLRERVSDYPAEQARWLPGADVTMPLPVLRQQLRYLAALSADPANATDMTIPLPVFRDAMELHRQAQETGPASADKDSAGHAWYDRRTARHGTGLQPGAGPAASGVPPRRGRHVLPEATDESHPQPTGPNGRGHDG